MKRLTNMLNKDKFTGFIFMFIFAFIAIFYEEIVNSYSTFNQFSKSLFPSNMAYASNVISFLISIGVVINALIFALVIGNRINAIIGEFKELINMIAPDNTAGLVTHEDE